MPQFSNEKSKPKIIIAGDSWGCGETGWDKNIQVYDPTEDWTNFYNNVKGTTWPDCPDFKDISLLPEWVLQELARFGFTGISSLSKSIGRHIILHKGLEQYFKDNGFKVLNISIGGGSNFNIVSTLLEFSKSITNNTIIIWIQTDPLRNLRPYNDFVNRFTSYDQIIEFQQKSLQDTYARLNSLDHSIICLGGCSKLRLDLIKPYKNLNPLIPSIPEWLVEEYFKSQSYVPYRSPEVTFSDWEKLVGKQFDLDSLDKLIYNKNLQNSLMDYPDLFWPDGIHPNRTGHKILFDYIVKELNL